VASACAWSVALVGLEGRIIEVEADIGAGLPRTVLVGLPDSALYQARDRCKAAVSNSGQEWPISLLTINLSPATLPKAGSHYDLAIVAAVLAAQRIFRADRLRRTVLLGELGLDGRVRPVRGVLPATLAAQQAGFTRIVVPLRQAGEAKLVAGIEVFGIASISQLVAFLRDEPMPLVDPIEVMGDQAGKHAKRRLDLADVAGQAEAKWACEVAAAGRHHMLFHGPPGVGKTMLAERVPGLLPDLDLRDSLEVSAVHSLAGFNLADELITRPPYSDPHHSASVASIVGGGQRIARPGAISCAHKGVLFLDDSTEAQSIPSVSFIVEVLQSGRYPSFAISTGITPSGTTRTTSPTQNSGGSPCSVRGGHESFVLGLERRVLKEGSCALPTSRFSGIVGVF
jgi:magnesium chelatase family protein